MIRNFKDTEPMTPKGHCLADRHNPDVRVLFYAPRPR